MAKKPRTAAQKRADAKRSREMKGKRPSFMRKRAARKASRRAARASTPRRRSTRMARKSGGGRRKGIVITPKRVIKALVVLDGAKRIFDTDVVNLAKHHLSNPGEITSNPKAAIVEYGKRILPGAIEITVGPKVIDKGFALASKGEPMIGKLGNAKLVTV